MPSPNHPTHADAFDLTPEKAAVLREALAQFDSKAENRPQQIDLNHPPKVPYKHQDFPRVVYAAHYDGEFHSHPDTPRTEKVDMTLLVNSQEELDLALENGYQIDPPPQPIAEVEDADAEAPRKSRRKK
jgi:hypothetical protein